MLQRNNT